jgi:hypothetical protein
MITWSVQELHGIIIPIGDGLGQQNGKPAPIGLSLYA